MNWRKLLVAVIFVSLAGCMSMDRRPRWELPNERTITFRPICENYRAPALGQDLPQEGLIPVFLFGVNDASVEDVKWLQQAMQANGFAVADGTPTINGTRVFFAVGEGFLKTQQRADLLYSVICNLDRDKMKLVQARYNTAAEARRMI